MPPLEHTAMADEASNLATKILMRYDSDALVVTVGALILIAANQPQLGIEKLDAAGDAITMARTIIANRDAMKAD